MRIEHHAPTGELDLSGTAGDLRRLAALLSAGEGALEATAGGQLLAGVRVVTVPAALVTIAVDDSGILFFTGAANHLRTLADNIEAVADMDDGGHLHADPYPDHPYLAEDSLSLVVNSPHGGMPRHPGLSVRSAARPPLPVTAVGDR